MLDPRLRDSIEAYLRACEWAESEDLQRLLAPDVQTFDGHRGRWHEGIAAHQAALRAQAEERPGLQFRLLHTYGQGPEVVAKVSLGPEEGLWAFRFREDGLLERITALHESKGKDLAPGCDEAIEAYFRTYNEDREDEHMALLNPDLVYFGSVSRLTAVGLPTARGIFRGARDIMGVHRIRRTRTFGQGRDAGVLIRLAKADPKAEEAEGALIFHFDKHAKVARLSVMWNPEGFLTRPKT
ncbi:MAG TPA: hypothetical protein VJ483_08420 [Holophagaceae bacterium]|nr:hypothetical protein [Holophagaceae bacterium]